MKKFLSAFLLLGLIIWTGYQPKTSENVALKVINGISMVSAKDASALLGLSFKVQDSDIVLKQDNIILKIKFNSPFVYQDKYIVYLMESPAVNENNIAYIPVNFFTDYLKVSLTVDKNQISKQDNASFSLYTVVKFLPQDVLGAINDKNFPYRNKILEAVELPRSMNIDIPKINMDKIIETKPLGIYAYDFSNELKRHGYSQKDVSKFSYNDYRVIEGSWKLTEKMISATKLLFPELKAEDISNWTYGDKERYSNVADKITLGNRFTEDQKKQLKQRGVLLEDTFYLLKDFYQPEVILAQPDSVIEKTIQRYYQINIDSLKD